MGLKKLVKKAGKFVKKAVKVAAPVAIAAVAGPAAAPLLAAGASPLSGILGSAQGGGALPAGQFSPQTALSGLAQTALSAGVSKAECAILGTCGKSGSSPAVASPAAVAVKSEAPAPISPLLVLGGLAVLFLVLRK